MGRSRRRLRTRGWNGRVFVQEERQSRAEYATGSPECNRRQFVRLQSRSSGRHCRPPRSTAVGPRHAVPGRSRGVLSGGRVGAASSVQSVGVSWYRVNCSRQAIVPRNFSSRSWVVITRMLTGAGCPRPLEACARRDHRFANEYRSRGHRLRPGWGGESRCSRGGNAQGTDAVRPESGLGGRVFGRSHQQRILRGRSDFGRDPAN